MNETKLFGSFSTFFCCDMLWHAVTCCGSVECAWTNGRGWHLSLVFVPLAYSVRLGIRLGIRLGTVHNCSWFCLCFQKISQVSSLRIPWCCTSVGACCWRSWRLAMPTGACGCKSGHLVWLNDGGEMWRIRHFSRQKYQKSTQHLSFAGSSDIWAVFCDSSIYMPLRDLTRLVLATWTPLQGMDFHLAVRDHVLCRLDSTGKQ